MRRFLATTGLVSMVVVVGGLAEPRPLAPTAGTGSDAQTFARIVTRMRAGTSYYAASKTELEAGPYATASVFNWRTPALYAALARVPAPVGRWTLVALVTGAVLWGLAQFARRQQPVGFVVLLVLGAGTILATAVPSARYFTEHWAGALLAWSALAYASRRRTLGAVCALAALVVRELVAPYCVLATLLAWRQDRREFRVWVAGAVGYAAYFGWHVVQVQTVQAPGALAQSWTDAQGWGFVLTTLRWNAVLLTTPWPVLIGVSALLALALVHPTLPWQVRLGGAAYLLLFCVIGKPFNTYWGMLTAPLWALLAAHGATLLTAFCSHKPRHLDRTA